MSVPDQTAALCLEVRDNGITGIVAQVLHFPAVCHPKFFPRDKYEYGSYVQNHSNPVLNVHLMEAFLDAYMPNAEPDRRHSPLLASSHKDLPPTCEPPDLPHFPTEWQLISLLLQ